jgi:hypothetical protein
MGRDDNLFQAPPTENSFIILRVEPAIAESIDPGTKQLWYRAQIISKIGEDTYEATIIGKGGRTLQGSVQLRKGDAWESSLPLVTNTKSKELFTRSMNQDDRYNKEENFPIPRFGNLKEGTEKQELP